MKKIEIPQASFLVEDLIRKHGFEPVPYLDPSPEEAKIYRGLVSLLEEMETFYLSQSRGDLALHEARKKLIGCFLTALVINSQ